MKRWKRLLMVGVTLCLAMMLLYPSIAGAQDVMVSIDAPAEVGEGTDFIARVTITDVTDFDAANYDVTYDPLILEVTDVTDGLIGGTAIPVDMWGFIPPATQGTIRVIHNVPGLSGVSGSGYLAEIHFHVVGGYCNTSDITLSNGVLSDNTATVIPATWVGDSVHVAGALTPTPTPKPTGGGGGGGSPKTTPKLKLDMMGKVSSVPMTKEGALAEALEATSPDGAVTLRFAEGTQMLDSEGDRIEEITVGPVSNPPEVPGSAHMIGLAYDFGPQGATFDPEIELIIRYDPESLSDGVGDLVMVYYDSDSEEWVLLPSLVDTGAHTVTVSISHFTLFAIVGREEAAFHFANLSISANMVEPGESVTITVEVTNTGGVEGICTVTLLVDGAEEAAQEMTLGPGESDAVTFSVTKDIAGSYAVDIGGLTDEFTVVAPFPGALVGGIIGGVLGLLALAAITVYLVVFRGRRVAA